MKSVSPEMLPVLLSYDPLTGILNWKKRPLDSFKTPAAGKTWNKRFSGKVALALPDTHGHLHGTILGERASAHRVAWAIYHGKWPRYGIDHINHVKSDNRISNLRDVTQAENLRNTSINKNNRSGFCGVSYCASRKAWEAYITVNNKRIALGRFSNKSEAIFARKAAEAKHGFHKNHGRNM